MLGQRPVDPIYQFRTPATTLRTRKENAFQHAAPRTGAKDIHAKALFQQPELTQPHHASKDCGGSTVPKPSISLTTAHPLGDKTPFINPNRAPNHHQNSPLPPSYGKLLLQKPGVKHGDPPIRLSLRPSSTRKSLRAPRTSGSAGRVERISNAFETPITRGDHWNVQDTSFELDLNAMPEAKEDILIEEEDYDDIEYMPPTAMIPPYEPPFELPDYKELGRALKKAALMYPAEDVSFSDFDLTSSEEAQLLRDGGFSPTRRPLLDLSELEGDDPLASRPTKAAPAQTQRPAVGHQRSKSAIPGIPSRPPVALRRLLHASSTTTSSLTRPVARGVLSSTGGSTGTTTLARSRPVSVATTVTSLRTAPSTRRPILSTTSRSMATSVAAATARTTTALLPKSAGNGTSTRSLVGHRIASASGCTGRPVPSAVVSSSLDLFQFNASGPEMEDVLFQV